MIQSLSDSATFRRRAFLRAALAILTGTAAALLPATVHADGGAVRTWVGLGTNNNFQNTANWTGGLPDFSDGEAATTGTYKPAGTDAIVFPDVNTLTGTAQTNTSVNFAAPNGNNTGTVTPTFRSFTFNTSAAAYSFITTNSRTLLFGDSTDPLLNPQNTGNIVNNSLNVQTFSLPVAFRFGTINAAVGNIAFTSPVNIGNGLTGAINNVTIDGAANVVFSNALTGAGTATSAGGALIKNGTGSVLLDGNNSAWAGRIIVNDGAVQVSSANSLGSLATETTVAGSVATGRVAFASAGSTAISVAENFSLGGRSDATSPHLVGSSGNFVVTGNITLASGGTHYGLRADGGQLNVSGPIAYGAGASGGTLTVSGTGQGVLSTTLGSLDLGLTKSGSGTWTLTGANAYTGATQISAGRLNVTTAAVGHGDFTLGDLATLGVTRAAADQALTVNSLTLGASVGGNLALDFGGFAPSAQPFVNAGSLTTHGTTTISLSGGGLSVGAFPLIDYSGTIQGSGFGSLALAGLPPRVVASLANDSVNTKLVLNVTALNIPKWTGAASSVWDINNGSDPSTGSGSVNWKENQSGLATRYLQTNGAVDSVIFDDTANAANTNVVLGGALSPVLATIDNSALNYIFSGPGKLTGATEVLKKGTGTLVLANTQANDFTGATTITGGSLQIGDGVTVGAGSLGSGPVVNNATLVLNRAQGEIYTFGSAVSGSGALVKQGDNTVTLTGANTFSGAVTIAGGIVKLGGANVLGNTAGGTFVQSGASLDVNDFLTPLGEVVSIAGSGSGINTGALYNNGAFGGATAGVHNLALTADATIGGAKRFDVRDGTLAGGGFTLTKIGSNTVYLANVGQTNLGGIVISNGRLSFEGDTTFGTASGQVRIDATGELGFENSTAAQVKPVLLQGGKIVFNTGTQNTLAGSLTLAPAVTNTIQGPITGAATLTISGGITGADAALTKTQLGTLILSGTNDYTGGTQINSGAVRFTSPAAVPATGSIALGPNSVGGFGFDIDQTFIASHLAATPNPATIALGVNSANNFNFADYSQASLGAYNNVTYSGQITPYATSLGGTYRLGGGGGTLTYTGTLTGNNTLEIGNAGSPGTVALAGTNSFIGGATIGAGSTLGLGNAQSLGNPANQLTNSGTLDLNGQNLTVGGLTGAQTPASILITDNSSAAGVAALTVNTATGVSTTYGGSIKNGSGGRVLSLLKQGAGTLQLNGANGSTFTGGTTIAGGRLEVRTNNAQVLPNGGAVTFTGNSTFAAANNNNSAATLVLGALTFAAGEGTIESNNINTGTGSNVVTFAAAPTRLAGATGNFTLVNTTASVFKVALTSAPTLGRSIDSGVFFSGADFAAYDAGGYVRPLNYASDSNALNTILTEDAPGFGTGATGKDVALSGSAFAITAQPTDTIRTLRIAGVNNVALATGATLTVGGILKAGSTAATISGGDGLTTGGAADLVIRTATTADSLTISAPISATSTGGLTKSGPGALIFSGVNAFTGGVWINGGSVQFANADAVPATGSIRLGLNTTAAFAQPIDQAFLAARVPATGNAATVALASSNSNDFDFSAAGLNYPTFSLGAIGTVTYSGNLTPNGGVYRLGGGGGTLTVTNPLTGSASVVVGSGGSGGVVVLPVANSHTGGTTLTAGTIRLGHAGALGSGAVTVNGGTLDLRGFDQTLLNFSGSGGTVTDNSTGAGTTTLTAKILAAAQTYSGSINNGSGGRILSLVKDGSGTLILSKANGSNYGGGTELRGGRLEIRTNNAQVLPSGTNLAITGTGTFAAVNNGGAAVTTAGLIVGNLSLVRGEATIESSQINASTTNVLTFAAAPTRARGATGNFTLSVASDPAAYKVVFTTPPAANGSSLNGGLYYNFSNFVTYDAAGYARALRYTGAPDANAAEVSIFLSQPTLGPGLTGKDVELTGGAGANITAQTGESLRTLKLQFDPNLTLASGETLTLTGSGLLKAGLGLSIISGGAGLTNAGAGDLVIRTDNVFDELEIHTALLASITGGLTKSGLGRLALFGTHGFSGGIGVAGGTLAVEELASVPNAGAVTIAGGATLEIDGQLFGVTSLDVQAGGSLGGTGTITAAPGGSTLHLDPGAVLSPGKLTLELGPGMLDLSAATAMGATGYLNFDLAGLSDQIVLRSGGLNLGSGFDADDFDFTIGTGVAEGTYVLFETSGDITGILGANLTADLGNGLYGTLGLAGGANGLSNIVLNVVPEPSATVAFLAGAALLLGLRRPRRRLF